MSLFDKSYTEKNDFAKRNPNYLKSMFGRTDLMPLWIADMDFKVAEPISNELERLVDRGMFAYEFNPYELFQAISEWNLKRHGIKLNTKAFVQVPGVLTGIAVLIRELSNKEDGVMIQTPVYHQFYKLIETANRKIIKNPLKIVDGNYQMDFEDIELKLKTENVKIILLCNPHNPVGRVWSTEELKRLIELAKSYNAIIVSDEIHSDIIYSGKRFNSITSFGDKQKHIAVLGSPAKTFGMQSISNGYLYIEDKNTYKQVKSTVASMYLDHGNAFTTYGTIAAYTKGELWVNELIFYLENTIEWVQSYVESEMPYLKLFKPEGTYQIWLDFSRLALSEAGLKQLVVDKAKLALTPGAWFCSDHSQFMRMNIASPFSKIQEAFYRLKKAEAV